ncbi:MAG: cupin domain-containing protein [Rhizobiaceae bacterium]|nr:cupin domain-containing protein [Rhizobiaceae bacterium]
MQWDAIEEQTPIPGFHGKVQHSDAMSFVLWRIDAGALLPAHRHVHEQVAHIYEGTFELTVDGVTRICGPGSVATVPSNALHSGRAITDCRILDAFAPVREDYRGGLTSGVIGGKTSSRE